MPPGPQSLGDEVSDKGEMERETRLELATLTLAR